MTFPIDFYIGSLKIDSHFLFETLAFMVGFRYFLYLRKRQTDLINTEDRIWILIGGALGAFIFSRMAGVMENPDLWSENKSNIIYYMSNKSIIGGLLGGLISIEITKKIIGVHSSSGDMFTFPIILAIIIGRIGCFLSGLEDFVYGTATTLPWGINFGDGIFRHPIALYEIVFLILLWVILKWILNNHTLSNGSLFKLFIASYLMFRFIIEYIKPVYVFNFGLSTIQIFCLVGLIYYYKIFLTPNYLFEKKF